MKLLELLLIFLIYVVLFFSVHKIFFWFKGRKKKNDLYNIMEIYLLEHNFKVDVRKIGIDKMLNIVSLSNAIIFAIVLISTSLIDSVVIRLLVMFVMLIPLNYFFYYGVGKYLRKKGVKK